MPQTSGEIVHLPQRVQHLLSLSRTIISLLPRALSFIIVIIAPVTNQMLNARKEENCIAVTTERKYYKDGQTWVKRSLRPDEWQVNPYTGSLVVPRMGRERILNEAASIRFIAAKTNIPVPKLHCSFEDCDAVYLVMEYVDGVGMNELPVEKRNVVKKEVQIHLETMRSLRHHNWGGPSGLVVPPYRVMNASPRLQWTMEARATDDLCFCHNDLSTYNIIVDPESLKINAIIDWEYAGCYPKPFEGHFFFRNAPSVAQQGEEDDTQKLLRVLLKDAVKFG